MSAPSAAFDFSGQVAIVTGAGSGIGRATAEMLADGGAAVACVDIDGAGAAQTAAGIVATGARAWSTELDVRNGGAVDALVATTANDQGRLDVMANIAGIIVTGSVVDLPDDDLDRILDVNLRGVYHGCRAAARVMTQQGHGVIINMSSGAIDTPAPGLAAYAMTKAAVAQLTKSLALELAPHGVRVNAVAPGFVLTAMTARNFTNSDGSVDDERREATLAAMRRRTPLGDVGRPDDIAYAVLFLSSPASRFVTGQILRPNGGVAMP